ncbi:MAG TPA: hypothetical protein VL357_03165 [Rariglobus sp.]|jgi:hypothetical protein|nr:hypothetical protein [Rariglobus sp.]
MRYIVARNLSGIEHPFLAVAPITHKQLKAQAETEGFKEILSAGFVHFGPALGVTTHYRSEGLGLKPRAEDARLIEIFYKATLNLIPEFQPKA